MTGDDLTLEDVELCIKVLTRFIQKYREAERVLASLARYRVYARPEDRLAELILARQYQGQPPASGEPELEAELSEEEKERLERIKAKLTGNG